MNKYKIKSVSNYTGIGKQSSYILNHKDSKTHTFVITCFRLVFGHDRRILNDPQPFHRENRQQNTFKSSKWTQTIDWLGMKATPTLCLALKCFPSTSPSCAFPFWRRHLNISPAHSSVTKHTMPPAHWLSAQIWKDPHCVFFQEIWWRPKTSFPSFRFLSQPECFPLWKSVLPVYVPRSFRSKRIRPRLIPLTETCFLILPYIWCTHFHRLFMLKLDLILHCLSEMFMSEPTAASTIPYVPHEKDWQRKTLKRTHLLVKHLLKSYTNTPNLANQDDEVSGHLEILELSKWIISSGCQG